MRLYFFNSAVIANFSKFQISICHEGTWHSVGIYHLHLVNEGIPPTEEVKEQ